MLTDERHQIIRDRLAAEGRVLAGELASRFGVSEDTVRRDLRELAKAGQCRRVYGGAVAPAPFAAAPVGLRAGHAVEEKTRLARATVALLSRGQTLFIDGGTTNAAIARAIPRDLELTIATNSLEVASALSDHALIELIVLAAGSTATSAPASAPTRLPPSRSLARTCLFSAPAVSMPRAA